MKRTVILLALLSLPVAGCEAATNAASGVAAFADKTAEKIERKTDDTATTIAVKGALLKADEKLANQVHVGTANGGIVSLWGTVPSPDKKAQAEQIAMSVKGVVRVVNAIEIGPTN